MVDATAGDVVPVRRCRREVDQQAAAMPTVASVNTMVMMLLDRYMVMKRVVEFCFD